MTVSGSSLWVGYAVVYAVGFGGLMYITRTFPLSWVTVLLPFVFPVTLVTIGAVASRISRKTEANLLKSGTASLMCGGLAGIRRQPMRWTTGVAWTMMNPFFTWIFPANTGIPLLRLIFVAWWLACAAFTGILLPRLIKVSRLEGG